MNVKRRFTVALAIGVCSCTLCYLARMHIYPGPGDFRFAYRFANDILAGRDPYAYPFDTLSVPYPLPVAIFGLPVFWLPPELAAAIFFGLSSALLAYGVLRDGPVWRLLIFTSPLYGHSLLFAQWPPIIMAMAYFPLLLFLGIIKPHIAAAVGFSGYVKWTRRGVLLTLALALVSLFVMPTWPVRWYKQLSPYEGIAPITVWLAAGPLLALAVLRWRDKRARLLFLMSLMPQRMFYDQLPLLLIPENREQMLKLLIASWLGAIVFVFTGAWPIAQGLFIYQPVLWMVLQPRAILDSWCARFSSKNLHSPTA